MPGPWKVICKEIGILDTTNEMMDIKKEAVRKPVLLHYLQY